MRLRRILIIAGLGALPASLGIAQGLSGTDQAIQRRQIRGLEQRSLGGGVDAGDIQRQRRDLFRDNGGPALDRRGRILERQLDSVRETPLPSIEPGPAETDRQTLPSTTEFEPQGPPSTFESPGAVLPGAAAARSLASGSSSDPVVIASRLMVRADDALAAGEPDRARSDLDLAGRLLGSFPEVQPGDASYPRLATARNRLNVLRDRLPSPDRASPPSDQPTRP